MLAKTVNTVSTVLRMAGSAGSVNDEFLTNKLYIMQSAFIEYRPKQSNEHAPITHFVIVVNGAEVHGNFSTQIQAKEFACAKGNRPVHVARVRHLQDRDRPAHWRKDPC